jgi:hypothetical protein
MVMSVPFEAGVFLKPGVHCLFFSYNLQRCLQCLQFAPSPGAAQ